MYSCLSKAANICEVCVKDASVASVRFCLCLPDCQQLSSYSSDCFSAGHWRDGQKTRHKEANETKEIYRNVFTSRQIISHKHQTHDLYNASDRNANNTTKKRRATFLLGKTNEILMIGVHVGQLNVDQQHDLKNTKTHLTSHLVKSKYILIVLMCDGCPSAPDL